MLGLLNSHEREAGDWLKLIRDADPRYRVLGIKKPPLCRLSIIEVKWDGPSQTAD